MDEYLMVYNSEKKDEIVAKSGRKGLSSTLYGVQK